MTWKIWYKTYVDGEEKGSGVCRKEYKYKGNVLRRARKMFNKEDHSLNGGVVTYRWIVSPVNPWLEIAELDGQISITEWYCGGSKE